MKRGIWRILAAIVVAFGLAAPAFAQSGSAAYSIWNIDGAVVRVRFMLPASEAKRLLPDAPRLDDAQVSSTAGALLGVNSAGGPCEALVQDQWVGKYYILAKADGAYRFEMTFQCPQAQGIALHDGVLFDKAPGHIDYAKVRIGASAPVLRLFTKDHQDLALPAAGPAPSESWAPFLQQGLDRLLSGADAAALVAGLLLLARRWRDLADIALALALGYAAALVLTWGSIVAPNATLAQAGMGAAAAILGLCALRRQAMDQGAKRGWAIAGVVGVGMAGLLILIMAAREGSGSLLSATGLVIFGLSLAWLGRARGKLGVLLFAPALLFGLLDGAVWAGRFSRLNMPGAQVVGAVWGYDLGAIAGLVAAAGVIMGLLWLAGRKLRTMQPLGANLAAAALTGLGLFWFVSRLYSV